MGSGQPRSSRRTATATVTRHNQCWPLINARVSAQVTMLADTQSEVAKALDIVLDAEAVLGSKRMKRFSMIVQKGTVKSFNVEADNTGLACSLADVALGQVKEL